MNVSQRSGLFVNCASGTLQADCQLGQTSQQCQSMCYDTCSDVASEEELDICMSSSLFLCCMFTVDTLETIESKDLRQPNSSSIVSKVTLGTTEVDWDNIKIVDIGIHLEERLSAVCTRDSVGIKIVAPISAKEKGIEFHKDFPLVWSGQLIDMPIIRLWESVHAQQGDELGLMVALRSSECSFVAKNAWITLVSRRQISYHTRKECKSMTTCSTCRRLGCDWCSWTPQAIAWLPPWVPDWQWIHEARSEGGSLCGVHHHVCSISMGTQNGCSGCSAGIAFKCLLPFLLLFVKLFS